MSKNASRPAPLATGTSLGLEICRATISNSKSSAAVTALQAAHIASRFRLAPEVAATLAALAFGETRP